MQNKNRRPIAERKHLPAKRKVSRNATIAESELLPDLASMDTSRIIEQTFVHYRENGAKQERYWAKHLQIIIKRKCAKYENAQNKRTRRREAITCHIHKGAEETAVMLHRRYREMQKHENVIASAPSNWRRRCNISKPLGFGTQRKYSVKCRKRGAGSRNGGSTSINADDVAKKTTARAIVKCKC